MRARRQPRWRSGPLAAALAAALVAVAALAGCARETRQPDAAPPSGEWRPFSGTWSAAGDRYTIDVAPGKQAWVVILSGALVLSGKRELGIGFQSEAITFSDGTSNSVGRAVWTDERGDRIFSELRGEPVATGTRITGQITGGTGRWTGITGDYSFVWKYVIQDVDTRIQGLALGLQGRSRISAPEGGVR